MAKKLTKSGLKLVDSYYYLDKATIKEWHKLLWLNKLGLKLKIKPVRPEKLEIGAALAILAKKNMKISVIIVNYNGKGYLKDCLDSVLKTDFKDFEVIVVDNASIDGSTRGLNKKVRLIKSKKTCFLPAGAT